MLSWVMWFLEAFGYIWSLGAIALAGFIWFGAFSLPGWVRASAQQAAVGLLVFAACTYVMRTTYSDGIAEERKTWQQEQAVEDQRRDAVLLDTQRQLQDWVEKYETSEAGRRVALRAIEEGSHRHDAELGLPVDSVRRLNAVRRSR